MTVNEKALQLHEEWQGKIETTAKCPINTREDLALAYTPGVAEPCKVIANNKEAVYTYTSKANTVAVISDGIIYSVVSLIDKGYIINDISFVEVFSTNE